MPTVTVAGSDGQIISIPILSAQNAILAQQILGVISTGVDDGSITPFTYDGNGPLQTPAGPSELIVTGAGAASVSASTSAIINLAGAGPLLLFGGTAASQIVVAGDRYPQAEADLTRR